MTPTELQTGIVRSVQQLRTRMIGQRLLYIGAALSVFLAVTSLTAISNPHGTLIAVLVSFVGLGQLFFSQKWKQLTAENFLQHLNRRFPELEESAQLLQVHESELSDLQVLQRQRVLSPYMDTLSRAREWLPPVSYQYSAGIIVTSLLAFAFSSDIRSLIAPLWSDEVAAGQPVRQTISSAGIESANIVIKPPVYTGLEVTRTNQLDLDVMEGSLVSWELSFHNQQAEYALQMQDKEQLRLQADQNGLLQTSTTVYKTGLYRIIRNDNSTEQQLDGIYTISVKLDQAPDIRLLIPETSTLEIARDAPAQFSSSALISDDFGIQDVEILASVAKGSGEAVKFRDQSLQFDHFSETGKGRLYQREWDFEALGMEPGDEVYFTVLATDNKQPDPNQGRSPTIIVRWLDERTTELAADGLAIDFIPEFFKSQRQIIIDTEQLLEDQEKFDVQMYKDTSYSIGQSQADLKQKYGQYLGDEFGEGPNEQAHDSHNGESDGHSEHDKEHTETVAGLETDLSISSLEDILEQFGHNHGDPEIGPITKRNPLALMKRAVSEMWQAERHLMQAEPELALAYEYEAYKYLKLARQADRIYVKRLGFVPPPVSEERRLTGELDDILSYSSGVEAKLDPTGKKYNQRLFSDLFQMLTTYSPERILTDSDRQVIQNCSQIFTDWSQQRPALIKDAATLEKILMTGLLDLSHCDNCIRDLTSSTWHLIRNDQTRLRNRNTASNPSDGMQKAYLKLIENRADKSGFSSDSASSSSGSQN